MSTDAPTVVAVLASTTGRNRSFVAIPHGCSSTSLTDFAGEPQVIAGHGRDRYVYSPCEGEFSTTLRIGDVVAAAGQEVVRIGTTILRAPLSGRLRGLTRADAVVALGAKVVEVDPRGPDAQIYGLDERPGRIARGVLEGVGNVAR